MLSSTATPRQDLNLIVAGHVQSADQFIANRVLPVRSVEKKTGRYWKIKPGSLLRAPQTGRAPGGAYPRDKYEIESADYAVEGKGLEGQCAWEHIKEYGDLFSLEQARTLQKVNQILRREELDLAGTLFSRSTFPVAAASGHDASNEWDDHANATPVDEVETALEAISNSIGDWRALGLQVCALMSHRTARHAKLCAQVRTTLGGGYQTKDLAPKDVPDAVLAEALGVDEVITPGSRYQSAGTAASPTVSKIWEDEYCLVFVRADPNAPEMLGLGFTPVWNEFGGEYEISTYEEPQTSSTIVKVDRSSSFEIAQSLAGYLIGNLKS